MTMSIMRYVCGALCVFAASLPVAYAQVPPPAEVPIQLPPITAPAPGSAGTLPQPSSVTTPAPVLPSAPAQGPLTVEGPSVGSAVAQLSFGASAQGTTRCGGAGQSACQGRQATLMSFARGTCPSGSFFDLGKWSCWTCSSGYERTAAAVDTDRACRKPDPNARGEFGSATYRGPLCPAGTFHDPIRGGECYSCPSGYSRSLAHIDAPNACFKAAGEEYSTATRHQSTIWPHDCWGGGKFWDGYSGGACWSCPSGYNRTASRITESWACSKSVPEQQSRATLVQRAQCGAGEFHDMRISGAQDTKTGGGCWTCPTAWDRTIYPVDGTRACEKDANFIFARATQSAPLTCGQDEIFDFIGKNASQVQGALQQRNQDLAALGQAQITQADGGTCWKCPPGTKRTTSAVYSAGACKAPDIEWVSPNFVHRGIFGLAGGEAVALTLVRHGVLINQIADGLAPTMQLSQAEMRRRVWQEIAQSPQSSSVLKTALFSTIQHSAHDAATLASVSKDIGELVEGTARAIQEFKVFLAQDALDAYDAWNRAVEWRRTQRARSQLEVAFDFGDVPPDFEKLVADSIISGLVTGGGVSAMGTVALMQQPVFQAIFPYALRPSHQVVRQGARFGESVVRRLAVGGAARTGAQTAVQATRFSASFVTKFLSFGPQAIITVATELIAVSIQQAIEIANARPKLIAGLATARNSQPDIIRLMATQAGQDELSGWWTVIMSGETPPSNPALFALSAWDIEARVNAAPGHPVGMPQAGTLMPMAFPDASDIGVSVGGKVWYIGKTGPSPSDMHIYSWTPAGATQMPVAAGVRIAVDSLDYPWVVNSGGQLWRWTGGTFILLRSGVRDIAFGGQNSVWILGTDGVVYRWDGQNWNAHSGAYGEGASIAAGPDANPWVVNTRGAIWRLEQGAWRQLPGAGSDIAVGVDGIVYVVGTGGQLWKMAPGAAWQPVDGAVGVRVGAGPAGGVYYTK